MGSHTTVDIIKTVVPIALDALVKSASALAAGSHAQNRLAHAFASTVESLSPSARLDVTAEASSPDSEALFNDLSDAGATLWQDRFDYFYRGNGSKCLSGSKIVRAITSGSDLVIYDESQGQMPNVKGYITKVFKDTALSDQATIELVDNLTGIIQDRWTEESLEWTPLTKTYSALQGDSGNDTNVDMLMYTACASDSNNALAGLAFYMFTYYPAPSS